MCGRYTLTATGRQRIGTRYRVAPEAVPEGSLGRFNVAPTQQVLTVGEDSSRGREASMARWGLVPAWARELAVGNRMINARAENLLRSRVWAPLVKRERHRCLIPADGFYEWIRPERPGQPRQPVRFTVDGGEPFAFAGLATAREWEGEQLLSCAIITVEANGVVGAVHDRMPAILPDREAEAAWLDADVNAEEAAFLCCPLADSRMTAAPANPALNRPGAVSENADLLRPPPGS